MKKILACCLCIGVLVLTFCSWVDPNTVDVYTGSIQYVSSDYTVTQLSGSIQYFFDDYVHLALDSNGYLYNASEATVSGKALINGTEYNIQMLSLDGFQIQQTYVSNTVTRTTWVDYNLSPDVLPSSWELPELALIFLVVILIIGICLILFGGYLH